MKKILLLIAIAALSSNAVAKDEYLYVMSAKAKLLSKPVFGSQHLGIISKGQKVITIKKTNNWFQVKFNGKIGWLSRLTVSPHPPMKRVKVIGLAKADISKHSRLRASSVSTTAAVRGLRADGRSRVNGNAVSDFAALEKMESLSIHENDVIAFMNKIE